MHDIRGLFLCTFRGSVAYETVQYTEYRLSNTVLIGASVTSFFCPTVWNVSGASPGLIHLEGSAPAASNAGTSIAGADGRGARGGAPAGTFGRGRYIAGALVP